MSNCLKICSHVIYAKNSIRTWNTSDIFLETSYKSKRYTTTDGPKAGEQSCCPGCWWQRGTTTTVHNVLKWKKKITIIEWSQCTMNWCAYGFSHQLWQPSQRMAAFHLGTSWNSSTMSYEGGARLNFPQVQIQPVPPPCTSTIEEAIIISVESKINTS